MARPKAGPGIMKPGAGKEDAARLEEMRHLGTAWQMRRRELERSVRMKAVEYASSVKLQGGTFAEAARHLGLSLRTLGVWRSRARNGTLNAKLRGRPPKDPRRKRGAGRES